MYVCVCMCVCVYVCVCVCALCVCVCVYINLCVLIIWFVGFYGISTIVSYLMPNHVIYIYIYIYHHHHVVLLARISLTLSRHFSLSFIASGRSSRLHPVSPHSCCVCVQAGYPAFAWPYVGVHRSTSLMS